MRTTTIDKTFFLFLLLSALGLASFQAHAIPLYGLKTWAPFELYRMDTDALGAPDLIGEIAFGTDLAELITVSDSVLYTIDRGSNSLVAVNTMDAAVLSVVGLDTDVATHPRGFDISPVDGLLYGVFQGRELRTIDPDTGATTLVADISGVVGIESIAFGPDGTLYASGNPSISHPSTHMYTLDTNTGFLNLFTVTGFDIDALTFGSDGFLYGTDSLSGVAADLIRIDPGNGSFANLGSTGVTGFNGITAAPVPGPSTLVLFGLSLLGLRLAPGARSLSSI